MNDSFVKVSPSDNLEIDYTISYDHNLIKEQNFNYEFKDSNQFKNLISNCRTFGFKDEVDSFLEKKDSLQEALWKMQLSLIKREL